jgi:hypothetical protein
MALDELADLRKLLFRLIVAVCEKALIAGKSSKMRNTAATRARLTHVAFRLQG